MTIATIDEIDNRIDSRPGAQLGAVREAKGYSVEHIAEKLNLRPEVLKLLEADKYANMPDPVYIKGYIRAYAKFLEMNPEPLVEIYNQNFSVERKTEKALWQPRRDTSRAERSIRWLTTLFGMVVLISVAVWWYKSQDNQNIFASAVTATKDIHGASQAEADIRLTDLSKMRSLLSSESSYSTLENKSD